MYLFTLTECNTPNNDEGVCINIKNCPALRGMYGNPNISSSDVVLLKNSSCGHDGEYPKVCCSSNDNHTSSTSSRLQGHETVSSSKLPSQSTCGLVTRFVERIIGGKKSDLG